MSQFYTYLHCKPDGTPFYVGKGFGKRCKDFAKGRNPHHRHTVAKYGSENIKVYVFPCESEAQALSDEIQQIAGLRRDGYELVNMTIGGDGVTGLKHSEITRQKIKEKRAQQKIVHSPETIEKIRAANIGKRLGIPRPDHAERMRGRKHTEEQKAKIVIGLTGRPVSEETRAKSRASNLGQTRSAETRMKLSLAHKGNKPTDETRRKMTESQLARWAKVKGMA